ncbi:hypothetical protein [Halodesulfurarchaeum sp.]|uniref:hypothetical protein n=1 Tax=Halodesulfurarchaeum sp. TaxID=1980530 RepID=UPI002FC320D2
MRIAREDLTVLFNRFLDRGESEITVSHPSDEIGDLLTIEFGDYDDCTIHFNQSVEEYAEARNEVRRNHPESVAKDLPAADDYVKAVLASGIIEINNRDEVQKLVERYGNPDLMAGHRPVFAGFDTNLLPWRIDRILGLRDPEEGVGYVNGFVLASGVRDELDWDYKCHDTDPFVDAFGDQYEEYWNQPLGEARHGRMGLVRYRNIRDIQQADEIDCDTGDEAIVEGYDEYEEEHRGEILLFSNDRTFVERARSHTILAQWIELPQTLPEQRSASWKEVEHLLHMLAISFGNLEVPSVTIFGIWRGKDELDWRRERLKLDARTASLASHLKGDLSIVETYNELQMER